MGESSRDICTNVTGHRITNVTNALHLSVLHEHIDRDFRI